MTNDELNVFLILQQAAKQWRKRQSVNSVPMPKYIPTNLDKRQKGVCYAKR